MTFTAPSTFTVPPVSANTISPPQDESDADGEAESDSDLDAYGEPDVHVPSQPQPAPTSAAPVQDERPRMGGKTVLNGRPVSVSNGNGSGAEDVQKQAVMDAELYGLRESVSGVFGSEEGRFGDLKWL
jgi:hypothetical protein